MTKNRIRLSMKSVSQRIISAVYSAGEMTTAELCASLSDIPRPTVYRYVRELIEAGALDVVKEERKRGGVERTLKLSESPDGGYEAFSSAMLCVQDSFRKYFEGDDPDPVRDMLAFSCAPLMLDDEEYGELLRKIGALIEASLNREKREGRKARQLCILSYPVMEETK
ncbi:MAG: helix-turn-helix domain-containing protein [Bullifex sp.]